MGLTKAQGIIFLCYFSDLSYNHSYISKNVYSVVLYTVLEGRKLKNVYPRVRSFGIQKNTITSSR